MKRFLFSALALIFSFLLPASAFAETEGEGCTVYTKNGTVIADGVFINDGCSYTVNKGCFTTSARGNAVIDYAGAVIDTVSLTRMEMGDELTLLEGVIGVNAQSGDVKLATGTELAYIKSGARVMIRVDDYGNAFNYCLEGSVKLVSKVSEREITLNKGEYVAVTVKRQIREMRTFDDDEINEMGVSFTSKLPEAEPLNAPNIEVFEDDFSDDGILGSINTNRVYKIKSASEYPVARVFYLDCDIKSADIEIYGADMELIAENSRSAGNLKPNVKAEGEADAEFYIYIRSVSDAEYDLYQERHISFYEKTFNSFKKLFIPALIAAACFIVWIIVKSRFSKDTRGYFKK